MCRAQQCALCSRRQQLIRRPPHELLMRQLCGVKWAHPATNGEADDQLPGMVQHGEAKKVLEVEHQEACGVQKDVVRHVGLVWGEEV